jgi:hypothetical protein
MSDRPVGHAGAAGDAVDQALGPSSTPVMIALGAAHFPQDVGVDAALAAGDVACALRLGDAAAAMP